MPRRKAGFASVIRPSVTRVAPVAGAAVLLLFSVVLKGTMQSDELSRMIDTVRLEVSYLLWAIAVSSLLHLLMIWGEVSLTHATAHARLAVWEMVHGRYKTDFWIGILLSLAGAVIPALALYGIVNISFAVAGEPLALMGLMLYEHAYVQAGQSVPLA